MFSNKAMEEEDSRSAVSTKVAGDVMLLDVIEKWAWWAQENQGQIDKRE